jgi:hypothetical protein
LIERRQEGLTRKENGRIKYGNKEGVKKKGFEVFSVFKNRSPSATY